MPAPRRLEPNRRVQLRLGAAVAIAEVLVKRMEKVLRDELQVDDSDDRTLAEVGLSNTFLTGWEVPFGHLADESVLERYGRDAGDYLDIRVGVVDRPSSSREYVCGGRFGATSGVEIDIAETAAAAEITTSNRVLLKEMEDILAHELTHAIDPKVYRDDPYIRPSSAEELPAYFRQLIEQKAFGQTMALRVLRCMARKEAAPDDARAFDECAAASIDDAFLALSPREQQRSLRDLYDAVQHATLDEVDVEARHPAVDRKDARERAKVRQEHEEWLARITSDMRSDLRDLLEEHGQVWLHLNMRPPDGTTLLLSVRSDMAPAVALAFPDGDPDRPKRYPSVEAMLDDLPSLWGHDEPSDSWMHEKPWTFAGEAVPEDESFEDVVGRYAMTANGGPGSADDDDDDDPDPWFRWYRAERDSWRAEVKRVFEESGGVYVEEGPEPRYYWLIYPSSRPDCQVQATYFDRETDEPYGHHCSSTIEELLHEMPPVVSPRLGKDTSKSWRDMNVVKPMTYRNNGGITPNPPSREELWKRWRDLVNMTPAEISSVLEEYPEAGLSRAQAKAQGVRSGRDSGRALVRMLRSGGRSFAQAERNWTSGDWDWARRQVSFISRMRAARGPLRDADGEPTRKLLSLWIWGHCPEKTR